MRRFVVPLVVVGVVAALVPVVAPATATPAARSQAQSIDVHVIRLPTGDTVRIGTLAGRPSIDVVAAHRSGITGRFRTVRSGADSYVFPAEAQPFLGRLLDPSLFDVTALARRQHDGRIPVRLSVRRGAHIEVPGLVVSARSPGTARGYLSPRGAAGLRTALAAACRTALSPGGTLPAALFGGVRHLALAGVATSPAPTFQQYTLKIKVLDSTGRPALGGFVDLINTDDGRKFNSFAVYRNGAARISVPAGHYSAITDVLSFRHAFVDRIIPVADFSVTRNDQTITLDGRRARSRVTVHVPWQAVINSLSVEFDRAVNHGFLIDDYVYLGPAKVFVAPTPHARHGSMDWLTGCTLDGTATKHRPYTYDLSFLDDGAIDADQSQTVAPFQLATVHARYYTDRSKGGLALFGRVAVYPFQFFVFGSFNPLRTPAARTEYIYGGPPAAWYDQFMASFTPRNPFGGLLLDGGRRYAPGEQRATDWARGPLAPGTPVQTSGINGFVCPACRTVHKLSIGLYATTDSTAGHYGYVTSGIGGPRVRYTLYRGRTKLTQRDGAVITVPALTGRYRVHMTTRRDLDAVHASTRTITDLVFDSSAGSGAPLPSGWNCGIRPPSVCTVLPLLHARVPLPTTMTDRLPIGTSSFVLRIAPIQGAKPVRITHARFETRLPGGTFRPATLHRLANGKYRVTLTNPRAAAGRSVTIRVVGRDSAGDSITQTTRAAYFIARR